MLIKIGTKQPKNRLSSIDRYFSIWNKNLRDLKSLNSQGSMLLYSQNAGVLDRKIFKFKANQY